MRLRRREKISALFPEKILDFLQDIAGFGAGFGRIFVGDAVIIIGDDAVMNDAATPGVSGDDAVMNAVGLVRAGDADLLDAAAATSGISGGAAASGVSGGAALVCRGAGFGRRRRPFLVGGVLATASSICVMFACDSLEVAQILSAHLSREYRRESVKA